MILPIYPAPNEHGSYADAEETNAATVFEQAIGRSRCRLIVVQVGPDKWAAGADLEYGCGNFSGQYGGPSASETFSSFDDALDCMIQRANRHFSPASLHPSDSCVTDEQRKVAEQFTALFESGWPRLTQLPLFGGQQ